MPPLPKPGAPALLVLALLNTVVTAGLVAHWPLDDGPQEVIGGHHGQVSGGVVFGAGGAAAHTAKAAEFNGSSASITVPYSTVLNPGSFTLTLWANADSTAGFASAITSRDDDGSSVNGYIIYNDAAGRWNFWTGGGGPSGSWPQLPGPAVEIGSWAHLALSYDAGLQTLRSYVNGRLVSSVSGPGLYSPNGPQRENLHIGSGADNGGAYHFDGLIDDVALWDEALSPAQVQDVMNDGVPGAPPVISSFLASPPFIDSGQSTTLSWDVTNAEVLNITPGIGAVANPHGSLTVSPVETTTYTLSATAEDGAQASAQITVGVGVELLQPLLNEFLADNYSGLADSAGDREDWIEIHNPNAFTIDLAGWSLTDNPARPEKWTFPALTTLEAKGYLVAFASEKNLPMHLNFKLDNNGEYLALVTPEGEISSGFIPQYPPQFDDISFGIPAGGGAASPMSPTPGRANRSALLEIAPAISMLEENPPAPAADQPLQIETTVTPRAGTVAGVTLSYRVGYGTQRDIPMNPGDNGNYSAIIPASAYAAGDMVRWFITAATTGGQTSRRPPFPDPAQSAEYFGTVVATPDIGTQLPVLHWFTPDQPGADTRAGARASLYFRGRFYDNIFCRIRGQSTANWPKHKYKFDFHRGSHFFWREGAPKVEEFNANSHYRDGYIRENAIFAFLNQAGTPASETMYLWIRRNGSEMGLFSFVEQVDEDFLGRHGFDASGAMYKAVNVPATLSPTVNSSLYRKVLQRDTPYSDLSEFTAKINISNPGRFAYVADEVNLPNYINVMAAMAVPFNHDQLTKNYYLYRDPRRGEWFRFPWDGDQGLPSGRTISHENWANPLYGDAQHTQELLNGNPNPVWQNHMHAAILDNPVTRQMYMRRLRTLADNYLAIAGAGESTVVVSGAVGATGASYHVPANDALDAGWFAPDFDAAANGWSTGNLGIGYENSPGDYAELITTRVNPGEEAAGATSIYTRVKFNVSNPAEFTNLLLQMKYDDGFVAYLNGVEVARANVSGNAAFNSTASNHSDSLAVNFEDFPLPGIMLTAGMNVLAVHAVNQGTGSSDMLIIPQLVDRPGAAGGYFENLVNGFAGQISAAAALDRELWSAQGINSLSETLASVINISLPARRNALFTTYGPPGLGLVPETQPADPTVNFGEIEFNPASGNQDQEFIELVNPNTFAVDLSGWRMEGGVNFTFPPGAVIPAAGAERSKIFLSPDVAAFRDRTVSPRGGEAHIVLGNYSGHLSNLGETLSLLDEAGRQVAQVDTPVTPGDAQRYLVVSEIMYHPAGAGMEEFIELMNISDSTTLDLTGISFTSGISFSFAVGTVLAPGARLIVTGSHFLAGSALSNGGETIKIDDATGSTVQEFAYDDRAPWPEETDGTGHSLVLINPVTNPDPGDPANWRSSALPGGSPGSSDSTSFPGGGTAALLAYAQWGEAAPRAPQIFIDENGTTLFTFSRNLAADDVELLVEISDELK
ncbi:MAG: lamin tail domain-containing protein, partial [Verrucomicrobiales bacterium]